jgi:DNA-binding transcriptional regulator YiaG
VSTACAKAVASPCLMPRGHAKVLAARMAGIPDSLIVQCRLALGVTQQEFAQIFGYTKRTVQRWEERGAALIPSEIETLARVLYPVRPDLAAQVAEAADTTLDRIGVGALGASAATAASDPIDSVVNAAAEAIGVTADAIRPAVCAAFRRAQELGLDVLAAAARLEADERRSK